MGLSCLVAAALVVAPSAGSVPLVLLGNQNVAAVHDGGSGSGSEAFGFTARQSGTAQSISVYLDSTDGATVALYADSASRPGARLDMASVSTNKAGWTTVPLTGRAHIQSGGRYWIALGSTGGSNVISYRDTGNDGSNLDYSGTGFANPYSRNQQWSRNPVSAYVSGGSTPQPPTARFSYSPASPVTGSPVTLDGSASTCPNAPCTYTWDDEGPDGPGGTNWPLGTGNSLVFTFTGTGTKYVRLTVTDALGGAATTEQDITVGSPPPSGAPVNTAPPSISGRAQQGQTLTAGNGSWTNSPTGYGYQWQRDGTNISGATATTYAIVTGDVGHTLDVVVRATNAGGPASATSASTATVAASSGGTSDCFAAPGACGFPDPNYQNVGVPPGTTLTNSGSITVNTAGTTINAMNVTGEIDVYATNVTIENSKVTMTGAGCGTQNTCGNANIHIFGPDTVTISHVELTTTGSTTVEHGIRNTYGGVVYADHVWQHGNVDALCLCGTGADSASGSVSDSYSTIHGAIANDHLENAYGTDLAMTFNHNTFFNSDGQTANIFIDTNTGGGGPCTSHLTITNNLLAGGGYTLYPCGNASSAGSSTMTVSGNRFARCGGGAEVPGSGRSWVCPGGADQFGYFPRGGAFGHDSYVYCPPTNGNVWSNNVWDDNKTQAGC